MASRQGSVDGITMPAKIRNFMQTQKPDIKIQLASGKKAYSTLDRIEGTASITAAVDTAFDDIEIEFIGTSRTFVERMTSAAAVSGRSEAFHQFLRLTQPGLRIHCPPNGILKAGQTYNLPFVFAIPQHLLLRICQHPVHNPAIRDAHLELPPTFGDKDLDKTQKQADDMAPEMASIRYGIFVRVTRRKEHNGDGEKLSLASKARRVRVIPASDELPPLDVDGPESDYTMRKEKTIKKGMLKGKLGTLVMQAAQPQSIRLNTGCRPTTMATLMLRFDPAEPSAQPPKLGNLASKLKTATFFSSTARKDFPSKRAAMHDLSQGMHSEQTSLASRCVASVEWTKHNPAKPQPIRRDSACSTTSVGSGGFVPEPSSGYKDGPYYTARLLVPVELPTTRTFVPTFHSCLISRIYQLKLELSLQTAGLAPSIDLKLPIQISAEANTDGEATPPRRGSQSEQEEEAEVEADDVSDFFSPRTIRSPAQAFVGRSRIGSQAPVDNLLAAPGDVAGPEPAAIDAPPDYSPFANVAADARVRQRLSGVLTLPFPDQHMHRRL